MSLESTLSEVFIKQRRNLLLISCILIFITYTKIDIQDISLLGVKVKDSNNPEAILWAAWSVFIYFFVRYYQYFIQEAYPVLKDTFKNNIEKRIENFSHKKMLIVSNARSTYKSNPYEGIKKTKWSCKINTPESKLFNKNEGDKSIDCKFTKFEILAIYVKSLTYMTFQHHNGSDYLFPILLAFSCAIYKAFTLFAIAT